MKNAANYRGGDRVWGTDLKFIHLNETARFTQNDVVSYICKKKKKEEDQNGVVLNDTVHLPPSPRFNRTEDEKIRKFFPRLSLLAPTTFRYWPTSRYTRWSPTVLPI